MIQIFYTSRRILMNNKDIEASFRVTTEFHTLVEDEEYLWDPETKRTLPPSPKKTLLTLPSDVTANILNFLPPEDQGLVEETSKDLADAVTGSNTLLSLAGAVDYWYYDVGEVVATPERYLRQRTYNKACRVRDAENKNNDFRYAKIFFTIPALFLLALGILEYFHPLSKIWHICLSVGYAIGSLIKYPYWQGKTTDYIARDSTLPLAICLDLSAAICIPVLNSSLGIIVLGGINLLIVVATYSIQYYERYRKQVYMNFHEALLTDPDTASFPRFFSWTNRERKSFELTILRHYKNKTGNIVISRELDEQNFYHSHALGHNELKPLIDGLSQALKDGQVLEKSFSKFSSKNPPTEQETELQKHHAGFALFRDHQEKTKDRKVRDSLDFLFNQWLRFGGSLNELENKFNQALKEPKVWQSHFMELANNPENRLNLNANDLSILEDPRMVTPESEQEGRAKFYKLSRTLKDDEHIAFAALCYYKNQTHNFGIQYALTCEFRRHFPDHLLKGFSHYERYLARLAAILQFKIEDKPDSKERVFERPLPRSNMSQTQTASNSHRFFPPPQELKLTAGINNANADSAPITASQTTYGSC